MKKKMKTEEKCENGFGERNCPCEEISPDDETGAASVAGDAGGPVAQSSERGRVGGKKDAAISLTAQEVWSVGFRSIGPARARV